jgi:hypothetical protein
MEKTQIREALKKIPDHVLDYLYCATAAQHFTEWEDNAERNGLLYLAQKIPNWKKFCMYGIGRDEEEGKGILKFFPTPGSAAHSATVQVGTPEFLEKFLYETYATNWCGCHFERGLKQIPTEILPYGDFFCLVSFMNCGRNGLSPFLKSIGIKDDRTQFKEATMEERVSMVREHTTGILDLHPYLASRLHIMPVLF